MRDDVSRNAAGKKQTKTKQKDKKQSRYLIDSLVMVLPHFLNKNHFFILSPHIHSRETCALNIEILIFCLLH